MVTTQSFQTHCRGLHWDLFLWPDSKAWHSLSGCDQVMSVMWPPGGVRPSGALSWCGLSGAGASSPEPDTEPEPGSSGIWHQATDRCYWDGDGRGRATEQTHFFSDYPENTFGVWYVSLESGRRFDDWWISTKSKYTGLVSVFCFGTDCDPIWFLALIIFTLSN